jgi:hypothetical protein
MFRSTPRPFFALPLLFLAFVTTGCGDDTPTTPTIPTPPTYTDTFTGSINPNGAFTHTFTANFSGTVVVTLTSVTPDNTVRIGLSLGTWNGLNCQVVLSNDSALQGSVITGQLTGAGNLCVRIYDVGNLVDDTGYEVQVVHP